MIDRIITGDLGVNTYLYNYSENKTVIIDPGADADNIIYEINNKNYQIRGILLTHGHFDHIGAVKELKDYFNTNVYISHEDSSFLGSTGAKRHLEMFESMGPGSGAYFNAYYVKNDSADVLLNDNDVLSEFGLKVIHTPGHSPGSICLYSENDSIIFSGDTLFKDGLGRTDFVGGNYDTLMSSIKKLMLLPKETAVYPGHGPFTTIGSELLSS